MNGGTPTGTFLVGKSESTSGSFLLSVRNGDSVTHYDISHIDSIGYFITSRALFSSLYELVQHYSHDADGLVCTLCIPCPKNKQFTNGLVDAWEISREFLYKTEKLGRGQSAKVWAGVWNNTTKVAVKVLKSEISETNLLREARAMRNLRHKHLVQVNLIASVFLYDATFLKCL